MTRSSLGIKDTWSQTHTLDCDSEYPCILAVCLLITLFSLYAHLLHGLSGSLHCFTAPPVTASAVKSLAAPFLIDPWTVGMTYPEVNITAGQSVEFKWPGAQLPALQ